MVICPETDAPAVIGIDATVAVMKLATAMVQRLAI
jgi:hypothetical protein